MKLTGQGACGLIFQTLLKGRETMKLLLAFVNPEKLWELKEKMFELQTPGMSVDQVMGIGKPLARMAEMIERHGAIPQFFPKMRVELVVPDDKVGEVVKAIREVCYTGNPGDGKIFILPVEDALRVRTNERGEAAIK
jgi:nitrogen regulatory protein PII